MGAFFGIFAAAALAAGPQPTLHDELLDRLVGNWVLQGTIAGQKTTHDVTAAWAVRHQFVLLHEVSREKTDAGEPAYEAMVFVGFDEAAKEYVCIWIDVWGGASEGTIGRGKRTGDDIAFLFKDKGSRFHNTFSYARGTDSWSWKMDNEGEGGALKPFARVTLTRKP